jgi:hypothetical protein
MLSIAPHSSEGVIFEFTGLAVMPFPLLRRMALLNCIISGPEWAIIGYPTDSTRYKYVYP